MFAISSVDSSCLCIVSFSKLIWIHYEARVHKLISCFEQYALVSLEKQEKFSRLIGEHHWELDLDSGMVRFNDLRFPFQVLGTESENTLTWLWAWANEQTEIPENLLESSLQLRAWGEREGIPEFISPSVDLNRADGHMFSLIASEVCRASAYYRGPYEGGAVLFLVFGEAIDRQPTFDLLALTRQFTNLISVYEFNHKNALLSYFRLKGLASVEKDRSVTATLESGEDMTAEFDEAGRLLSINGNIVSAY